MLRVGLIGFGLSGRSFHAPIIRAVPGLELACILQRSGSRAAEQYPDVRIARTLPDLLQDATIQLCVIATPNATHFELARECLLANRNVVVDKPLATTLAEALELTRLATERKRLLTVYQSRRWDGDFQTVSRLIHSGALGRVVDYEVRYDRFRPDPRPDSWKERNQPGAGIWFDLGPHLVDQALMLFGPPSAVRADIFAQREWSPVDDAFDVVLEYPRLRVMLHARMMAQAPGPHFAIHGTKGTFVKYGMDPQEEFLRRGKLPPPDHWGEEDERQWGLLSLAGDDPRKVKTEAGDYRRFYAALQEPMERGMPPPVTAEQALRTMQVLVLARRSNEERRNVPWQEPGT